MSVITQPEKLKELCAALASVPYMTVDTEFLRDKTYYPQLCLIQVAGPDGVPFAIDPLAGDIDLAPFLELLDNPDILKIFHAARQDIEIFYNLTGVIPHPIFDTQVAAMVCGHGDSIGYNNLVQALCGKKLDKGVQFTDWSRRPLSKKQLSYALDDVTYLRDVYLALAADLEKRGREDWVAQEMAVLTSVDTYENPPELSWQRVKIKSDKPKVLAVLREVAAWREREAQRRDVPRGRIIKDDTLADLAAHAPKTVDELVHIRGLSQDMARGRLGREILEAVHKGLATPPEQCPQPDRKKRLPQDLVPVLEMLKMLLRIECSRSGVAPRLVAAASDLEAIACDDKADVPALKGWRYEVFGQQALALKKGEIWLGLENNKIVKKIV